MSFENDPSFRGVGVDVVDGEGGTDGELLEGERPFHRQHRPQPLRGGRGGAGTPLLGCGAGSMGHGVGMRFDGSGIGLDRMGRILGAPTPHVQVVPPSEGLSLPPPPPSRSPEGRAAGWRVE